MYLQNDILLGTRGEVVWQHSTFGNSDFRVDRDGYFGIGYGGIPLVLTLCMLSKEPVAGSRPFP
jgi:hypothetical protein